MKPSNYLPLCCVVICDVCLSAATASKGLAPAPAEQGRIVADPFTNEFAGYAAPASSRAKRAKEAAPCHDFDADRAAGRTSKVYDINGIVSIFCRQCGCITVVKARVLHTTVVLVWVVFFTAATMCCCSVLVQSLSTACGHCQGACWACVHAPLFVDGFKQMRASAHRHFW